MTKDNEILQFGMLSKAGKFTSQKYMIFLKKD